MLLAGLSDGKEGIDVDALGEPKRLFQLVDNINTLGVGIVREVEGPVTKESIIGDLCIMA
jgi:hypothetical protein